MHHIKRAKTVANFILCAAEHLFPHSKWRCLALATSQVLQVPCPEATSFSRGHSPTETRPNIWSYSCKTMGSSTLLEGKPSATFPDWRTHPDHHQPLQARCSHEATKLIPALAHQYRPPIDISRCTRSLSLRGMEAVRTELMKRHLSITVLE